jgi:hypothetical protein
VPRPEALLREELRQRAERLVLLKELRLVQPASPGPMWAEAALPGGLADPYRGHPARPSAAAARKARALRAMEEAEAMVARRLARAERLVPPVLPAVVAAAVREAQQVPRVAAAQPKAAPEEAEVWDAVVVPRPAAEQASAVARRPEAAEPDAAEEVQRWAAGPASVAVRLRGAEAAAPDAEEAPRRGALAGVLAAAVARRQVGPGAPEVRLSAAAWAGLPSTRLQGGRLAPSAPARPAHARGWLRVAQP